MAIQSKTFTNLYHAVRDTSRSEEKVMLLADYLSVVSDDDFGWAVYLLAGGSYRGAVSSRELREWAAEIAQIPTWLVEESYSVAGDLAETISLLVSGGRFTTDVTHNSHSLICWIRCINEIKALESAGRKQRVFELWASMSQSEILVFTKLLTGGLRIGVSKGLVVRALARSTGVSSEIIWQHLANDWKPEALKRQAFLEPVDTTKSLAPYPFFLAYPVEPDLFDSLQCEEWQCEWKWDGIRAQVVIRDGEIALWSRGSELVSSIFPELCADFETVPDGTVLDGEIVAWSGGEYPDDFSVLQTRLNRKNVTSSLQKSVPIRFIAYDLLELSGEDLRQHPLHTRRSKLVELWNSHLSLVARCVLSQTLTCSSWEDMAMKQKDARAHHAEGLMLKRLDSLYGIGRTARGAWWKWKVAPHTVDAVLLYAQKGHGRRADLFTDYTFGVWDGDILVSFTKAYSGLNDCEIKEVDSFIKKNTLERFGPVRTVKPDLVFEIAFEGIWASKRHRSGVAVRFPRIVRWRRDKPAAEADSLDTLRELLR